MPARRLGVRRRIWWVLPVAAGGLVTLEHLLSNLGEPSVLWLQAFALLDLRGVLSPVLFLAGIAGSPVLSARILKRYRAADPAAAFGLREAARAAAAAPLSLPAALLLLRLNRAAAYGLDWYGHRLSRPPSGTGVACLRRTAHRDRRRSLPEPTIPINALYWLLALTPLAVLLVLLVVLRRNAAQAGPLGYLVAAALALLFFSTPIPTLAIATANGFWDVVFILYTVWTALGLYALAGPVR